ncbi:MAG TPA: hypothetical protein VMU98_05705 [Acidimicrobiales bacterium]|nr:hypothetical protein [Acidimicrobiales bacterium]
MTDEVEPLYDYGMLRQQSDATMLVVSPEARLLVLGGNQSTSILSSSGRKWPLRRRRGGGGVVELAPADVWVDFWIPRDDPRWREDLREASSEVGQWWAASLRALVGVEAVVHEGGLEGEPGLRVACFAGRGPGEVFVNGRKAVGVTQWRVREGMFLSTVLRASNSSALVDLLNEAPASLAHALDHHSTDSLGIGDVEALITDLRDRSGPWRFRRFAFAI